MITSLLLIGICLLVHATGSATKLLGHKSELTYSEVQEHIFDSKATLYSFGINLTLIARSIFGVEKLQIILRSFFIIIVLYTLTFLYFSVRLIGTSQAISFFQSGALIPIDGDEYAFLIKNYGVWRTLDIVGSKKELPFGGFYIATLAIFGCLIPTISLCYAFFIYFFIRTMTYLKEKAANSAQIISRLTLTAIAALVVDIVFALIFIVEICVIGRFAGIGFSQEISYEPLNFGIGVYLTTKKGPLFSGTNSFGYAFILEPIDHTTSLNESQAQYIPFFDDLFDISFLSEANRLACNTQGIPEKNCNGAIRALFFQNVKASKLVEIATGALTTVPSGSARAICYSLHYTSQHFGAAVDMIIRLLLPFFVSFLILVFFKMVILPFLLTVLLFERGIRFLTQKAVRTSERALDIVTLYGGSIIAAPMLLTVIIFNILLRALCF